MAVASVTKITAASSEGFDAAVREGLASQQDLTRHHRPSRDRAQGERGEWKNRRVPGDNGGDLHPRKLRNHSPAPLVSARAERSTWSMLEKWRGTKGSSPSSPSAQTSRG